MRPTSYLPCLSVFLILGAAACGSNSGSPAAPDAVPAATATIAGTVGSEASSSGVSAQSRHGLSGLRVTVVGTGLTSTTDGSGQFVLTGVPTSQAVTLRFEGSGIDARLELSGLVPGQTLRLEVSVAGGRARVVGSDDPSPSPSPSPTPGATPSPNPTPSPNAGDDDEDETEFTGTVQSIAAPDLTVAGRLVHTDAGTRIRRHGDDVPFATIQVGTLLEVEGHGLADGSIRAKKLSIESGDDDDDHDGGNSGSGGGDDDDDDDDDNSGSGGGNSGPGGN